VPSGRTTNCTFIPCGRCFIEWYGSFTRIRSMGIRVQSAMTWSTSPRPGEGFMQAGVQDIQGGLVDSPGGKIGYPKTCSGLRERLVLA